MGFIYLNFFMYKIMILFCGMYFFRIFAGKTIKLIKTNIKKQGNNNVNVCLMSLYYAI